MNIIHYTLAILSPVINYISSSLICQHWLNMIQNLCIKCDAAHWTFVIELDVKLTFVWNTLKLHYVVLDLSLKDSTVSYLLCLYVADPATSLVSNSVLGTLFSFENWTAFLLS